MDAATDTLDTTDIDTCQRLKKRKKWLRTRFSGRAVKDRATGIRHQLESEPEAAV
jgi:hypothetical protein